VFLAGNINFPGSYHGRSYLIDCRVTPGGGLSLIDSLLVDSDVLWVLQLKKLGGNFDEF
jgi:hypothetical protein